jgi:hypothetical protein
MHRKIAVAPLHRKSTLPGVVGLHRSMDFDQFVAETTDGLLRTAYLIAGDLHEAEDLVQETLFKVAARWPRSGAWSSRPRMRGGSSSIARPTPS